MTLKKKIDAIFPLTPMQAGMLFHALKEPDSGFHIEQVVYTLQGDLDIKAFKDAWRQVAARHFALRSFFVWEKRKEPLQVVHGGVTLPWTVLDLRNLEPRQRQRELDDFLHRDRRRGFSLSRPPLTRFALLRETADRITFVWTHHHILIDGWCLPILLRELIACYRASRQGEAAALAPAAPYKNYITWLKGRNPDKAARFWQNRLKGVTGPFTLGKTRPPNLQRKNRHAAPHQSEQIRLGEGITGKLQATARSLRVTPGTILQTGWALLLSRYSGEREVLFGSVVSGRPQDLPGVESMVGLFINTLPVRVRLAPGRTLAAGLQELHAALAEQMDYAYLSLAKIQALSGLPADTPLFESILAFENYPAGATAEAPPCGFRVAASQIYEKTGYPLNLMISPGARLSIRALYDPDRFDARTIRAMLRHYRQLLTEMAATPDRTFSEFSMLSTDEKESLPAAFNPAKRPDNHPCRIHRQVARLAAAQPDHAAVVHQGQILTYARLNRLADIWAAVIRDRTTSPHPRVAIVMPRCPEMIVAMLAVLKAGGAYIPLDPAYPSERIRYILKDAGAALALICKDSPDLHQTDLPVSLLALDGLPSNHRPIPEGSAPAGERIEEDFPAYIIYTSGSTGTPKGVMISHAALENLIAWHRRAFRPGPPNRIAQAAQAAFDASVWEIWSCLGAGAALHLLPPDLDGSAEELQHWLLAEKIDTCFLPTPLAQEMLDLAWPADTPLTLLHTGGDILRKMPPPKLPFALANHYGPTECGVIAASGIVTANGPDSRPHVGRPIDNMQAFILDADLNLQPPGVPGELYLAGRGLGIGYLNRPDFTAQHFLPNPYTRKKGGRLYKTGDLARYLPNGKIEIMQRLDDQVKIRGFRVETGEIESVLLGHPDVREVRVTARPQPSGARRLAAYIAAAANLKSDRLRRYLAERLPDYMLPPDLIVLSGLPKTPSGKIDTRALLDPVKNRPRTIAGNAAPRTKTEEILCRIWAGVLNLKNVGIHDDFFSLGGDSILSIRIMSRASREGVRFTLGQLFENPTIAALAPLAQTGDTPQGRGAPVSGPVPLTPIQQWFFEQQMPQPDHFNQSMLLKTTPDATPEILARIAGRLPAVHPSLRLRFVKQDGQWRQSCDPRAAAVPLSVEDLSGLPAEKQRPALEALAARYQTRLDLGQGPLCRFVFFQLSTEDHGRFTAENRLLIIIHHLAVDGVSWRILLEQIQTAFHQIRTGRPVALPGEKVSFQKWAHHLAAYANSEQIKEDAAYWLDSRVPALPPLPVDFSCPPRENTAETCDTVRVLLDRRDTAALLHRVPEAYRTRIDEVLLAALLKTFCAWTGETALRIALEGHGRQPLPDGASGPAPIDELDISQTTGWFTTLFPVIFTLEEADDPGRMLLHVKEQLRRIPRKGAGFGPLKYLCRDRAVADALAHAPRAAPWPEVAFNYLGRMSGISSAPPFAGPAGESCGPESGHAAPRDHLINIGALITEDRLQMNWIYSRKVHRRCTIERLADGFRQNLAALIAHCLSPEAGRLSASDVPGARLDQQALENFLAELES